MFNGNADLATSVLSESLVVLALIVFVLFIRIIWSIDVSFDLTFNGVCCFEVPHEPFALAAGRKIIRSELDLCFVSLTFDVVVDLIFVHFFQFSHGIRFPDDFLLSEYLHLVLYVNFRHDTILIGANSGDVFIDSMHTIHRIKVLSVAVEVLWKIQQAAHNYSQIDNLSYKNENGQLFNLRPLPLLRAIRRICL